MFAVTNFFFMRLAGFFSLFIILISILYFTIGRIGGGGYNDDDL